MADVEALASFCASLRAARRAVIDRSEREASLQRVRGKPLFLRFELANRDRGEITVLRLRGHGEPCAQPFDARLKPRHPLREHFGPSRILFACTLYEHPSATCFAIGHLELAQFFASAPQARFVTCVEVPQQRAAKQACFLTHFLDEWVALIRPCEHALDALHLAPLLELSGCRESHHIALALDRCDARFELVLACFQCVEVDATQGLLERWQPLFVSL